MKPTYNVTISNKTKIVLAFAKCIILCAKIIYKNYKFTKYFTSLKKNIYNI